MADTVITTVSYTHLSPDTTATIANIWHGHFTGNLNINNEVTAGTDVYKRQEIREGHNKFYINDEQGKQIAEIVFVPTGENLAIIEHTDVDESLNCLLYTSR